MNQSLVKTEAGARKLKIINVKKDGRKSKTITNVNKTQEKTKERITVSLIRSSYKKEASKFVLWDILVDCLKGTSKYVYRKDRALQ